LGYVTEFSAAWEETHDDFPSLQVATIRAIQTLIAKQQQLVS
jgi:hypothetical protein